MSPTYIIKQAAYVGDVFSVLCVCESVRRDDPEYDYSECELRAVEWKVLIGQLLALTPVFNRYELICNPC